MLLSWLLPSLSDEVFSYVIGITSSLEVWNALASTFGSISCNRQLQLNIKLQELNKNYLIVSQYLQKAKSLADELAFVGRTTTPSKFNVIIYKHKGSEYHNLITTLNLRLDPISSNELHNHFLLMKYYSTVNIFYQLQTSLKMFKLNVTLPPYNLSPSHACNAKNKRPYQICNLCNHIVNRYRKKV